MPEINRAFKDITCKIVYYGPGFGGKTTNLQYVSEKIPSRYQAKLVSLATEQDQTLFFDHLPLDMGDVKGYKTKFQLYTVPGQVFYNATRKLVLRGTDGLVFVADSQAERLQDNINSFQNMVDNLREHGLDLNNTPLIVQYNKRDLPNAMTVEELNKHLNPDGKFVVFEAVSTEGIGVRETLREASLQILRKLNDQAHLLIPDTDDDWTLGSKLGIDSAEDDDESGNAPRLSATDIKAPVLEVMQDSAYTWNGIGLGSGTVTLSSFKTERGDTEYTLSSNHKYLFLKRNFVRTLKFIGEDVRTIDDVQRTFFMLRDVTKQSASITAYVETGRSPRIYLVYPGLAGEVRVGPFGEPVKI